MITMLGTELLVIMFSPYVTTNGSTRHKKETSIRVSYRFFSDRSRFEPAVNLVLVAIMTCQKSLYYVNLLE